MIIATIQNRALKGFLLICIFAAPAITSGEITFAGESAISRLINRGDEEMVSKHYILAHKYYQSALAYDSNNVNALIKVSAALEKLGDLDQAIVQTRLATQIEPGNIPAHLALAHCLECNRDSKTAAIQYERVLDLMARNQDKGPVRDRIVQLLIDADELERADRLTRQWLKENGKDANCHFNRALVLSQSEKSANWLLAMKYFNKALAFVPDYPIVHYQLGLLYLKLENQEAAKSELETFIALGASPKELQLAQSKLNALKTPQAK